MQFTAPYFQTTPSVLLLQESEAIPGGGSVGPVNVPLPDLTTSVQLIAAQTAGPAVFLRVTVVGADSGLVYENDVQLPVGPTGLTFQVSGVVDSALLITWRNASVSSATFTLSVVANTGTESSNVMCTCTCSGGGSSGLLAYGVYTNTNAGSTGTMGWTAVEELGAVMLQPDTQTFDFPANSIVVATLNAGVTCPPSTSWEFQDTAIGNMTGVFANGANPDFIGGTAEASYAFDSTLNASTQFTATSSAGVAFGPAPVLILEVFARP